MAHPLRRVAPLSLVALALAATPASAAPDRTLAEPMGVEKTSFTWNGKIDPGANTSYLTAGDCSKTDATTQCDETLVRLADDFKATSATSMKFLLDGFTVPASDYDIRVYESDKDGKLKSQPVTTPKSETYEPAGAGAAATAPGDAESVTLQGTTLKKGKFYLMQVVYFAAAGGYRGTITLTGAGQETPIPGPATR